MKFGLALLLTLASIAVAMLPAAAGELQGKITNSTSVCVWFTIDTASAWTKYSNKRFGFIKPYTTEIWAFNDAADIKFRAQPRQTAACTGPQSIDMEITSERGQHVAALTGPPSGAFRLYWAK